MSLKLKMIAREFLKDMESKSSMKVGKTLKHPDGRTVKITSGQYLSNGRVSNFWHWREIREDGTLGPDENGYGW